MNYLMMYHSSTTTQHLTWLGTSIYAQAVTRSAMLFRSSRGGVMSPISPCENRQQMTANEDGKVSRIASLQIILSSKDFRKQWPMTYDSMTVMYDWAKNHEMKHVESEQSRQCCQSWDFSTASTTGLVHCESWTNRKASNMCCVKEWTKTDMNKSCQFNLH